MKKQRDPSDKGQVLVIVVLALVGLLVAVGLAIDGGTVYLFRRRAQNAADAAAKAGARRLYRWQVRAAYPDDASGEVKVLEAICDMAERNGVEDTDGNPGNHINDNVTAYFVDSIGERLSASDTALGEGNAYEDCLGNRCRPDGVGRCCGVEVEVQTQFDTVLIRLTGPVTAPVEAVSASTFDISDGYGGVGGTCAYALGSGCGNDQFYMSGDNLHVEGTAHSNDGVHISGDTPYVEHLEYVNTDSNVGEEATVDDLDVLPAAEDPNLPFDFEYYRAYVQHPENRAEHHTADWTVDSSKNGVYWVEGNVTIPVPNVTLTGLYFVEGNFEATGDGFALSQATVVASGYIHIRSNDAPISPWADDPWGLSLYSARDHVTCGPCNPSFIDDREFGISIRGDHGPTPGVFYAPRSRVCINADENDVAGGGIFADSIDVRGDAWRLVPWRPSGGGVGELELITLVK
ncbi:MAG: pilus assembly protein TadG-related protein [Anaerolineae bacterium]|jgi:hypothetical protein